MLSRIAGEVRDTCFMVDVCHEEKCEITAAARVSSGGVIECFSRLAPPEAVVERGTLLLVQRSVRHAIFVRTW